MAEANLILKQTLNVTCMRNDTFRLAMVWKDSTDTLIDLTAYTFIAEVKKNTSDLTNFLSFSDSDFTKDASGNLTMNKTSAEMDLVPGFYYFDIQATKISDSTVQTWAGGNFIIKQDVTD